MIFSPIRRRADFTSKVDFIHFTLRRRRHATLFTLLPSIAAD
jgi:hypothetical protein